jgi:hypothetical protein
MVMGIVWANISVRRSFDFMERLKQAPVIRVMVMQPIIFERGNSQAISQRRLFPAQSILASRKGAHLWLSCIG